MRGKIMFIRDYEGLAQEKEVWGRNIMYNLVEEESPVYLSYFDDLKELHTIVTTKVNSIYEDMKSITLRTEDYVYHILKTED